MLMSLLLSLNAAHAADLFVETTGSDAANDCLSSGSPCATIDHALTQSTGGDTVNIGAGTFSSTAAAYPMPVPDNVNIQGTGTGITTVVSTDTIFLYNDAVGNHAIADLDFSVSGGAAVYVQSFGGSAELTISNSSMTAREGLRTRVSSGSGNNIIVLDNVDIDGWRKGVEIFGIASQHISILNSSVYGSDQGIEVSGSSANNHVYLQNTLVDSNGPAVRLGGGGPVQSLVARDSLLGGDEGIEAFLYGETWIRAEGTSFESSNYGISVIPGFADLHLDVRDSDFANQTIAAIDVLTSSPTVSDIAIRGAGITSGVHGVQLAFDSGTQSDVLIDGLTASNLTGTAIAVSNSVSGVTTDIRIDRCALTDNNQGIQLSGGSGDLHATIARSLIAGSLEHGVLISDAGTTNTYTLRSNTIRDNAFDYSNPGFFDLATVNNSGNATVDATDNWWGTNDNATISSHISQNLPVSFTNLDATDLFFEVYPPRGTPSPSEIMLFALPGSALVDHQGDTLATVLIDGVPHPVIWGAPDGSAIRVARGPLTEGPHLISVTDAAGHASSSTDTYVVDPSPPDDVVVDFQPWVRNEGSFVRIQGEPNTYGRLFASPLGDGPPICHPQFIFDCLQIPLPVRVERPFRTDALGYAWLRIERPAAATHPDYISLQVVHGIGPGQRVSPPSVHRWLAPTGDADLDGLPNLFEHALPPGVYDNAANPYGIDSDGDLCLDGEDANVVTPSSIGALGFPTDCDPFTP